MKIISVSLFSPSRHFTHLPPKYSAPQFSHSSPVFAPVNVHEIYPLSHWPGRKGYIIYNPDGLQGCFFGETQKYPEHKSESPAVIRVHILGDSRSQNIALTAMPSVSLCIATQEEETSGGATS